MSKSDCDLFLDFQKQIFESHKSMKSNILKITENEGAVFRMKDQSEDITSLEALAAMDVGNKYLFAMVCNLPGFIPILVKNALTPEKFFQLQRALTKKYGQRKAYWQMSEMLGEYVSTVCDFILAMCFEKNIARIAVGTRSILNPYTVRATSLQKDPMLNLSIHLLDTLRFRSAFAGISILLVNEKNTTKTNALELENIARPKTKKRYDMSLHRDVNAAINIGRLAYGNDFAKQIIHEKKCFQTEIYTMPLNMHILKDDSTPHFMSDSENEGSDNEQVR